MRFQSLISSFISGFLFMGCIDSPILNHAQASVKRVAPLSEDGSCEIQFKSEELCAEIRWVTMPTDSTRGEFTLTFKDVTTGSTDLKAPNHSVFVKLWMPSMGHGSSPVQIQEIDPGKFQISDVFFVMPGSWEIWIQLKSGTQVIEQNAVAIEI